jgi:hypothetical protein
MSFVICLTIQATAPLSTRAEPGVGDPLCPAPRYKTWLGDKASRKFRSHENGPSNVAEKAIAQAGQQA